MKLGMDFGTTTSATVAILPSTQSHKETKFLCGDDDDRPVPSAVAINRSTREIFRGRDASDRKSELSETCEYIHSIKTYLAGDRTWKIGGQLFTPVDIAAEVMRGLVQKVKERTGEAPSSMTVAVPIGFSPEKRSALRKAAEAAGVKIDAFVSEPTAAFFANYADLKSASRIVVFDWGGGTLDVSVLRITDRGIEEVGSSGMSKAGDDLDMEIAVRMHNKICRSKGKTNIAFSQMSPVAQDKLLVRCERAKRILGEEDVAVIEIAKYGELDSCYELLDYGWFADIAKPFIDKAVSCLDSALAQAGMTDSSVDYLVMTGGSSNLRPLLERLKPRFSGDKLHFPDETIWNVAEGAAMLAGSPGTYRSAQNVDLILADGERFRLLSEGESISGWSKKCTFGIVDASNEARLVIDTGDDSPDTEKFFALNVPSYGFLHEKIILEASVSPDQVLEISARSTNRPASSGRVWQFPKLRVYYELP